MSTTMPWWVRVRLVPSKGEPGGPILRSASDVATAFSKELATLDREHFVCLHLDIKNRLRSQELIAVGHLSAALVHPREVFKGALLANAASIVLVHNHPSGDPEPSRDDHRLTDRLVAAGDLLGIPVLDHVILAEDGHASLLEEEEG
ncbi:MAG: JAB domain-containing protein [Acidobacteriota bacterium]